LTTIIVLSKEYGMLIPGIASFLVLIVSFFMLKFAHNLERILSTEVIEICSRVLSLLLAALAVDFIYMGVNGFITGL
jgi:small neutral amino acid transporter SnatA (MarC family)